MVTLCDDLLVDILSRLPIKSLFRFKSMSQSFNQLITSIISDPKLLESNHTFGSVQGFFHFSYNTPQNIRYLSLHPQHPVKNSGRSIDSSQIIDSPHIIDSCNGLLLLDIPHTNLFSLYNPTIQKQCYFLKPINWSPSSLQNIGLAYDPNALISNNRCKLVFVYKWHFLPNGRDQYGFKIFSPDTLAWRKVEVRLACRAGEFVKHGQAVYFNESLHWIRESGDIIVFDMEKNIPRIIGKPFFLEGYESNMWFGVTRGSINVVHISKTQVVIFVLHDYVNHKWGCVRIKINCFPPKRMFCPVVKFFDGEWIVLQSQGRAKDINSYNMRLDEWKKIGVLQDSKDGMQEYIPFIPSTEWLDTAPLNNNFLGENYSSSKFENFWPRVLRSSKRASKRRRVISQVPSDSRPKRVTQKPPRFDDYCSE